MSGQVYAVASGKGGVGKTTTVVNLGVTLRASDHSVALVDADLGMPNLATILGVGDEPGLHDVLAGEATLEEALIEEAPGFAVVPGSESLAGFATADPDGLGDVIESLAEEYEFVLIDTGAGLSYEDVLPLALVDGIVLVTSPDPAARGDARRTAEIASLVDGALRGVVVTRSDGTTDAEAIADELGTELLGAIPDDPAVPESTASGRPLEAAAPDSPAAEAYRELAATLADGTAVSAPETEGAGGDDGAAGDHEASARGARTEGAGVPSSGAAEAEDGARSTEEGDADPAGSGGDEGDGDGAESGGGFFARLRGLLG